MLLRGSGPLGSVQKGFGCRVVIIAGENGKKDVALFSYFDIGKMAPPVLLLLLLNSTRNVHEKREHLFSGEQCRAPCIWPRLLHHTDAFDGLLGVQILGVFLDCNHLKHTHCSCTTQPHCSSAGKYRFCRTHTLSYKHHHLPVFASKSPGWHFILVTQIVMFTVLMPHVS